MQKPASKRVVSSWAAPLLSKLVQSAPVIVTEHSIVRFLADTPTETPKVAIQRLVRLGWLRGVGVRGAWAFLPPGVDELADPYVGLRGWRAVAPNAAFCLAGETAAWHLGYLPRRPDAVTVWLSKTTTLPSGLKGTVRCVTTDFPDNIDERLLAPSMSLLKKRRLDVTTWASRLPGFGPEALLVQMAQRPASIESWVDVAERLKDIVADVDVKRLDSLLAASNDAARQRAAYFLRFAGAPQTVGLPEKLRPVELGTGGRGHWDNATGVNDHLLRPLLDANVKG
jgi:hypothetical protein